eukprot:6192311-Pleurochrysis_carterae.AAC.2
MRGVVRVRLRVRARVKVAAPHLALCAEVAARGVETGELRVELRLDRDDRREREGRVWRLQHRQELGVNLCERARGNVDGGDDDRGRGGRRGGVRGGIARTRAAATLTRYRKQCRRSITDAPRHGEAS